MTKISSSMTFFYKAVFPLLWFGILAAMGVSTVLDQASSEDLWTLIPLGLFAGLGFLVFRLLVWDLADEVYDGGDFLLVRIRGEEERIALSNLRSVSATRFMNPPRITLTLAEPCRFGERITFSPRAGTSFLPFARNPIAEDLIARSGCTRSTGLSTFLR